ncbi:hypothetical protein V4R08_16035 (plasmid) [Nitrobacter sp. NHB1]|uniref:hypothetical protein n=1 Tax=Nitrobacter sp. NHB1 TaxID=3119830 RepID=UPI003000F38E
MTRSVNPWCLKRKTSLIRRIDNLSVGIGLPHRLNEEPVTRLSLSAEASGTRERGAHDRLKSLLTIPRNPCSRSSEIGAHDPAKHAVIVTEIHEGGGITSAMFTGRKILNRPPQDFGK